MRSKGWSLLACLLLLLTACGGQGMVEGEQGIRVYYYVRPDEERPDVVALDYEWYSIPESVTDTAQQCDMILKALRTPLVSGHESVLPTDIIPTCEIVRKQARIEVGSAYLDLSELEKSLVLAAISLSLLELEGVRYVTIKAEGREQRLLGNYIAPGHIVLEDDIFINVSTGS